MRYKRILIVGVVGVLLLCLTVPRPLSKVIGAGKPNPTVGDGIKAWEYGRFTALADIHSYSWDTRPAGKHINAKTMNDLYKKIGGRGPMPDGGIVAFYNVLGAQGWELVYKREFDAGGKVGEVLFKRPKR